MNHEKPGLEETWTRLFPVIRYIIFLSNHAQLLKPRLHVNNLQKWPSICCKRWPGWKRCYLVCVPVHHEQTFPTCLIHTHTLAWSLRKKSSLSDWLVIAECISNYVDVFALFWRVLFFNPDTSDTISHPSSILTIQSGATSVVSLIRYISVSISIPLLTMYFNSVSIIVLRCISVSISI